MFTTASAIFSVVLIVTGVAKLVRPTDVEKALRALGLPAIRGTGLVIGLAEVVVGSAALFFQPARAVQAVFYAVFAVWVLVALRRDIPLASCGCLGRDDTPPTVAHVVLNAAGALVSAFAFFGDSLEFVWGIEGIAQIVVIAVGAFLAYVVLADGARLEGVRAR